MPSGWDTAANIISDAAIQLGIAPSAIADPWANTVLDTNIIQLRELLKPLGRRLLKEKQWTQLQQTWVFPLKSGTQFYPMPPDFGRIIDQTEWNRTAQLPLGGPMSPQQHEFLLARTASGIVYKLFRVEQDQFMVYPAPTTTDTVAFEYISRFWVQSAPTAATLALGPLTTNWDSVLSATQGGTGGNFITMTAAAGGALSLVRSGYDFTLTFVNNVTTVAQVEALIGALAVGDKLIRVSVPGTPANLLNVLHGTVNTTSFAGGAGTVPDKETPSAASDILWFDPALLVAGLRLEWRQAKGLDSTAEAEEYNDLLKLTKAGDGAASVLSLNRRSTERLVSTENLPQTGYGQ